jgi:hypothetical protein
MTSLTTVDGVAGVKALVGQELGALRRGAFGHL